MKKWFCFLLAAIMLLATAGCGGAGSETTSGSEGVDGGTAGTTGGSRGGMVQVRGSDTEVNLVQRLAEEFMAQNPGVQVAVTGGGSGTGIAALINKEIDIANASREMTEEEIAQARANGVEPLRFIFAMDGLSVIINAANPVQELDLDQVGAIYRGEITNWQDVGGPDMPISLYGRQSNSGTFVFFRDVVLKGDYSPQMKGMNGNAQIVEGVTGDPAGIGYVGIGYAMDREGNEVEGIKVVGIKAGGETVMPTMDNVTSGKYPLTRPLNHYTNGQPQGAVRGFLEFELSARGQEIVVEEGFYPVTPEYQAVNQTNFGAEA